MPDAPPRQRRDCRCKRARHAHGTKGAYLYDGCRCPSCTAANAHAARAYRRKCAQRRWNGGTDWTDSSGTRRRLQALAAAGWSLTALAVELDMSPSGVGWLRQISGPCLRSTARQVEAVYDRLWDKQPTGRAVTRTRAWALRRGWLPPLAWDDELLDDPAARPQPVHTEKMALFFYKYDKIPATERILSDIDDIAVERAIRGDRVRLTKAEKSVAVATMTRWGMSAAEIAERLSVSSRTVVRRRSAAA